MVLPEPLELIVTPDPEFTKVTLEPAMRFKAPCAAFEVPLVENREGRREALKVPEEIFDALALKAWAADCAAEAAPAAS
jgi:hypothetical protein